MVVSLGARTPDPRHPFAGHLCEAAPTQRLAHRRRRVAAAEAPLLIGNRSRQRAPNLSAFDRFILGLITLFVRYLRLKIQTPTDDVCYFGFSDPRRLSASWYRR